MTQTHRTDDMDRAAGTQQGAAGEQERAPNDTSPRRPSVSVVMSVGLQRRMLRRLTRLTAVVLAVAILSSCQGSAGNPSQFALELIAQHTIKELEQPSGLSFHDDRLYTVGDHDGAILSLAADGTVVDQIEPDLSSDEAKGIEALAVTDESVWLALEPSAELVQVRTSDGAVLTRLPIPEALDGNNGLEGLMIDPDTGNLLTAKEEDPALLFELGGDGVVIRRMPVSDVKDISGLAPFCDGEILVVSQEDRAVHRLTRDGDQLQSWPLDVKGAEGIAFDGVGRLYVVDEAEARLLVFELSPSCR